jgi:hypothetical protein
MIVVTCRTCGHQLEAESATSVRGVSCPRCGQSLDDVSITFAPSDTAPPAVASEAATMTDAPSAPAARPASPTVPGYEVLEELGRGGMGIVYRARQLNPRRIVALKMIRAGEYAGAEQLARFRTEAEAIARLQHPAIIHIHQVGEWHPADGGHPLPFLTLEYVEGHSLARRLASRQPVTPRQAADLVRQLALGAHYAHGRGIVHRDLKPANVLLAADGARDDCLGGAKIVDFGLAKTIAGMATVVPAGPRTQTGAVLGTPSYMAPEQADGKGTVVGPAVDVYALGAILYECLTGQPPFQAETTLDTLIQVVHEEPVPPRQLRPQVPRDLEKVCLQCLQKDPARRYASAADLADDLGRFLAGEPVRVRPPSAVVRLGRWARRRKELVYLLGGALTAVALVAGGVVLLRPPRGGEASAPVPGKPSRPNAGSQADDSADAFLEARDRMQSSNNLHQLSGALHNFHDANRQFPPPAICSKKDGKPLLSWRVILLPYVEQAQLYRQFKLDEPWDSEHNKKLLPLMPKIFAAGGSSPPKPDSTHYQAVVGKGTVWELMPDAAAPLGAKGVGITSISDGTSNTIILVEAADAVPWTKPEDVAFDPQRTPRLGGLFKGGFHAAFADGRVSFLRQDADPAALRAAFTRNGGEVINMSMLEFDSLRNQPPPPEIKVEETPPVERTKQRLTTISGRVSLNGKPLADAEITFVQLTRNQKEPVLAEAKTGTDAGGIFTLRIDEERVGALVGKCRVMISKKAIIIVGNEPEEQIPARYNAKSELTVEVRGDTVQRFDFDLRSP